MPDHEPCGAEIIQLERMLVKLIFKIDAYLDEPQKPGAIQNLLDTISTAKALLS